MSSRASCSHLKILIISELVAPCRSLDRDMHQQLFFHQSEVQKELGQAIAPGVEVSFSLAPDTQGKGEGNPMAVHVQLLPEGTLEAEKRLPGSSPSSAIHHPAQHHVLCTLGVTAHVHRFEGDPHVCV